ncbi:MAG: hypothetical protein Tsb0027_16860 [Wenzhouxiangellaceae bacterium]
MRLGRFVFATLMSICGSAQALDCGSNSARIKGKLIVRGDSSSVLRQLDADNRVQLQNRYGAVVGYRYEFFTGRRLLQINTRGGIVSSICRD